MFVIYKLENTTNSFDANHDTSYSEILFSHVLSTVSENKPIISSSQIVI
jgi:hypothetical protein